MFRGTSHSLLISFNIMFPCGYTISHFDWTNCVPPSGPSGLNLRSRSLSAFVLLSETPKTTFLESPLPPFCISLSVNKVCDPKLARCRQQVILLRASVHLHLPGVQKAHELQQRLGLYRLETELTLLAQRGGRGGQQPLRQVRTERCKDATVGRDRDTFTSRKRKKKKKKA